MMKSTLFIFFFAFLAVDAQRRIQTRPEVTNPEIHARGRGRSRFSAPEYTQSDDDAPRRLSSRKRTEPTITFAEKPNYSSPKLNYEVEEKVQENIGEVNQSKVLTETNYEAQNVRTDELVKNHPSTESNENVENQTVKIETDVFEPEPEKVVPITRDNVRNNVGNSRSTGRGSRNGLSRHSNENVISNKNDSLRRSESETSRRFEQQNSSKKLEESIKDERELRREIVRNSVPKLPQPIGFPSVITRPNVESPKPVLRKTLRSRVTNKNEETIPSNKSRGNQASSGIRSSSKLEENHRSRTHAIRSRNGNTTPKYEEPVRTRSRPTRRPTESIPSTTTFSPRARGSRRRTETSTAPSLPRRGPSTISEEYTSRSRTGRKIEAKPLSQVQSETLKSRTETNRQNSRFKLSEESVSTPSPRHRFNGKTFNIDETKLEVLPLFEGETKIVAETGRKSNQIDSIISSATENQRKVISPPEHDKFSVTTSKPSSTSTHHFVRKPYKKTEIKESVIISQVTEVTSKRTITRKPISRPGGANKFSTNKRKTKSSELSSSEEDISESDNYPEPFKALLQSKKNKFKESRSTKAPEISTTTKKTVTSSPTKTTTKSTTTSTEKSIKYYAKDFENEIQPKLSTTPISRTTRKRLHTTSTTTNRPEYPKYKKNVSSTRKIVSRSTVAPLLKHNKENKYSSTIDVNTSKPSKNVYRGYHHTISKGYSKVNKSEISPASLPKSSKYSSRYRSSGSLRSVARTSTSPPVYIPTVPSLRSHGQTVKPYEDSDLGLELITIDAPVRSISSANLINEESNQSSDANFNSLEPADEKSNEKSQSIIEQIINSITGLTTDPTNSSSTQSIPTVEPTKSSAILSLTPRVSPKLSRDDLTELKSTKRDASTSEKPSTTVIQRILNSLSAIQAGTTTETTTITTTDNTKEVGSNFNTLSSKTTTPSSSSLNVDDSETASFSSTPALTSSTINPLVVLDTITDEQILQKKTIGKLLEILNSLTTEHSDTTKLPDTTKLVYVTPKLSNYYLATPSGTLKNFGFTESYTSSLRETGTETVTPMISTTSTDTPSSTPNEMPTPSRVDNDVLLQTTPKSVAPIVLNIKNLLTSTTKSPKSTISTEPNVQSTTETVETNSTPQESSTSTSTTETKMSESTTFLSYLSTVPTFSNFEVSPESVSIFSVNDLLSNNVTPDDDFVTTTVSIPSRMTEMLMTTEKTTTVPSKTTTGTPSISTKKTATTPKVMIVTPEPLNKTRSGKLLQRLDDISSNQIDSTTSSTSPMGPDYFIFAVLPNNTILRKKPRAYPKETPFVIVGVFPNNTIVRKYPNGTLVPMEPVIRVSSMPSEKTSNSVNISNTTPYQTSTMMMDMTSTTLGDEKNVPSTTDNIISATTLASTTTYLPSISELLNGNTVQVFNSIVNNTPSYQDSTTMKVETTTATPKTTRVTTRKATSKRTKTTTTTEIPSFFNSILSTIRTIGTSELPPTTTPLLRFSSTYRAPYYSSTNSKLKTSPPFTTSPPTTSVPFTSKPIEATSTVFPYFSPDEYPLLSILSTERPRRKNSESTTTISTITETSTTTEQTTQNLEELLKKPIDSIKPKKPLTEEQKKDLEAIRKLEKEQAAILKQLSFLTNLNLSPNSFNNEKVTTENLANRIVSLAKERDSRKVKTRKTTTTSTTTTTTTTEATKAKKPVDDSEKERMKQIESLIKLLNMNGITPSPKKASNYGTSNEAILAALLKERGIGPSTPKQLAEQIEQHGLFTEAEEVTKKPTRKPRPRTQPTRGPIMQRLNWLLNALAPPPTTKKPKSKSKSTTRRPKTTTLIDDEDILNNEPTQFTTVVTSASTPSKPKGVSQEDIQKLIKQLEAIQKDPSKAKNFDLTSFKSLQNLNKNNVQVFMPGSSGVSQREVTKPITRAVTSRSRSTTTFEPDFEIPTSRTRAVRTSTYSPSSTVSNSLYGEEEDEDVDIPPTPKSRRPTLPPVRLRPVSGVSDDAGSMVRGRLITAAVNVTRAISGFLGSAFQSAAQSFARALSSGSLGNYLASGSSLRQTADDEITNSEE